MKKARMTARDRRRAIVKAALPLFARKGFARTTTKDLARAAGVSEPLLYRHFPGKEALYLEIQNFTCKETDTAAKKLAALKPSASTLVHLVYFLMRALVMGQPKGAIAWETRHRLMLNSFLADGAFARLIYRNRFGCFCSLMAACLKAARASGEVVESPVSYENRSLFAHHVGAWLALTHLPRSPVMNYKASREGLLHQVVWFSLRGMGMTDKAIAAHYHPEALALSFGA